MRQQNGPATVELGGTTFGTVAERAKQGRLSQRTIWKLIASGKLRATRFGRSVRISDQDWATYIATCQKGRTDE